MKISSNFCITTALSLLLITLAGIADSKSAGQGPCPQAGPVIDDAELHEIDAD